MRVQVLTLALLFSAPAFATDDHHEHKRPTQVVVVEKHDHAAVGVLAGAALTYWLLHRHKKRHERPLVLIPPERSEECSATVERVLESCGVTK